MKKIFWPVLFLLAASLAVLSSLSLRLFWLQLLCMALGFLLVYLLLYFDWSAFLGHRWLIWGFYGLILILLGVVLLMPAVRNIRSWIAIGPFNFQPVEFMKIALILVYAQYFSKRHLAVARWRNIITSFLFFALPAALILLEPELGSTLILFGVWFGFLLVSGLPLRRIAAAGVVFVFAAAIGWLYVLHPYQKQRILGMLYPQENTLTVNYSVIQSKIAIGSAGFWGKGYKQGTQTQLGFLSEPSNDFVFAALLEEWGLLVGLLAVAAFIYLLIGILRVGMLASQNFEKFLCLGTVMVFSFQFLLNTGSTTGFLPVVGVTFPFLSYGGSSLLTDFFLLGMVNAISQRT